MTNNEVNKIISEYMGVPWCPCNDGIEVVAHDLHPKYTESLDALVPVWERLKKDHNCSPSLEYGRMDGHVVCFWANHYDQGENTISNNFQEAAARATAKAILATRENK
jgi:hypothetical protein